MPKAASESHKVVPPSLRNHTGAVGSETRKRNAIPVDLDPDPGTADQPEGQSTSGARPKGPGATGASTVSWSRQKSGQPVTSGSSEHVISPLKKLWDKHMVRKQQEQSGSERAPMAGSSQQSYMQDAAQGTAKPKTDIFDLQAQLWNSQGSQQRPFAWLGTLQPSSQPSSAAWLNNQRRVLHGAEGTFSPFSCFEFE